MSSDQIRNISQTYQEREIIKTAPDMVVYINNLPYIFNPYITDKGVIVNFNNFITAISGSCDINSYKAGCSINMSIPNHYKHLFMAPGGNKILATMSIVKIFGKGYFLGKAGETIYYRTFYGVISNIGYTNTKTSLEITINCEGILRLFELIQSNMNPSVVNFATAKGVEATPMGSRDYQRNPLIIIKKNLLDDIKVDETVAALIKTSLFQENSGDTRQSADNLEKAIKNRFITRWSPILDEFKQCVRIFGIDYTKDTSKDIVQVNEDLNNAFQVQKVTNYLPDFFIGNIELIESRINSRLERIDYANKIAAYEGYQDLDGNIIFKPPLYNLDVTDFDVTKSNYPQNPFIINMYEVEEESEQEDEQAVRSTRISVKGLQFGQLVKLESSIDIGVVSYMDMNLFSKFGMREEPVKEIPFLLGDKKQNFGFAIAELFKSNMSYRSYRCSIPFRPELKLGFPCYIAHHDIYGYVRNISWSYNVGGKASMSLQLEALRRKPMLPTRITSQDPNNKDNKTVTYEYRSTPNLVSRYSKADNTSVGSENVSAVMAYTDPEGTTQAIAPSNKNQDDGNQNNVDVLQKNLSFDTYYDFLSFQVKSPKGEDSWLISKDSEHKFDTQRVCDSSYLSDLYSTQPYTDDKGYELFGPLPWGRWQSLNDAITLFTVSLDDRAKQKMNGLSAQDIDPGLNPFILSATGNPSINQVSTVAIDSVSGAISKNVTRFTLEQASASTPEQAGIHTLDPNSSGDNLDGSLSYDDSVNQLDRMKKYLIIAPDSNDSNNNIN